MAVFTPQHTVSVDAQLYLPQSWADDPARRKTARIPEDIGFRTKGEIALSMLRAAHADGVPLGEILLGDADYGRLWALRQGCREVGMRYGVGVHPTQKVWDAEGTWTAPMTDHFEGRSWPGWQHHVTLALTCHALLVGERCVDFPPAAPCGPAPGARRGAAHSSRPALRPKHRGADGSPGL